VLLEVDTRRTTSSTMVDRACKQPLVYDYDTDADDQSPNKQQPPIIHDPDWPGMLGIFGRMATPTSPQKPRPGDIPVSRETRLMRRLCTGLAIAYL
jgi:hypothetical protein